MLEYDVMRVYKILCQKATFYFRFYCTVFIKETPYFLTPTTKGFLFWLKKEKPLSVRMYEERNLHFVSGTVGCGVKGDAPGSRRVAEIAEGPPGHRAESSVSATTGLRVQWRSDVIDQWQCSWVTVIQWTITILSLDTHA